MKKIVFKNKIYISFDDNIDIDDYHGSNQNEKEYYQKYKAGGVSIHFDNKGFIIDPEDVFHVYNDLFLMGIIKVINNEKFSGAFLEKERYGLVLNPIDENKIQLYEYYFEKNFFDENRITQELIVPKDLFLKELYKNIILFNEFYSKAHNEDLSFWDEKIEEIKNLLEA